MQYRDHKEGAENPEALSHKSKADLTEAVRVIRPEAGYYDLPDVFLTPEEIRINGP